ncbi:Cutinase transcription factor 1 beta like protein [Verticillium longisporum]|nr:Cutinase transcription factor 1 beta like protein [Verticillium longisporum]
MDANTSDYRTRKRAPKACLKCRSRKVRCDVTRTGQPCTNCRLDDRDCAVIPRVKVRLSTHANNWDDVGSSGIRKGDLRFLEQQGCFRLPSTNIFNEFINKYFFHVHPMLPILQEHKLWAREESVDVLDSSHLVKQIPMVLIQAMLFAACPLLHDFDVNSDDIVMAQAALLLTYWASTVLGQREQPNSRWLRTAISHAKRAGAHDYVCQDVLEGPERQNEAKRLWWGCVIRDRILSLCVRRSINITGDNFDFVSQPRLSVEDFQDELHASRVHNAHVKRSLVGTVLLLVDLCVALTEVLSLVYPQSCLEKRISRTSRHKTDSLVVAHKVLEEWHKRALVTETAASRTWTKSGTISQSLVTTDSLFKDLLWMYYQ